MAVFYNIAMSEIAQQDNAYTDALFLDCALEEMDFKDCEYRYMGLRGCRLRAIKFNLQKAITVLGIAEAIASGPCQISVRHGQETHHITTVDEPDWRSDLTGHVRRLTTNLRDTQQVFDYTHAHVVLTDIEFAKQNESISNSRYERIIYDSLAENIEDGSPPRPNVRSVYMLIRLVEFLQLQSSLLLHRLMMLLSLATQNEPHQYRLASDANNRLQYLAGSTISQCYEIRLLFTTNRIDSVEAEVRSIMAPIDVADFSIEHFQKGSIEAVLQVLSELSTYKLIILLLLLGVRVQYKKVGDSSDIKLSFDVLGGIFPRHDGTDNKRIESDESKSDASQLIDEINSKISGDAKDISSSLSQATVTELPVSETSEFKFGVSIGRETSLSYTISRARESKPPELPAAR